MNILPNCRSIFARFQIYSIMILQALRAALLKVAEACDCYLLLIRMLTEALKVSKFVFPTAVPYWQTIYQVKNTTVNITVNPNLES